MFLYGESQTVQMCYAVALICIILTFGIMKIRMILEAKYREWMRK